MAKAVLAGITYETPPVWVEVELAAFCFWANG